MKHQNGIILSLVKEALKTRGFQDPDLNPVINGRNSLTIEDNKNDLFIKVYSKSTLMLNSLLAQQIIEMKVPTPKFLFHSGVKDRVRFAAWQLVRAEKILSSDRIKAHEIDKVAESICKIHSFGNQNKFYGPHIPVNERENGWKNYLKSWVKNYILGSKREIEGFNKNTILNQVQNYIDILPLRKMSSVLLHGDINISNFMLQKGHLYITDLDYSIFGDSAWEFASAVANWGLSAPCYHSILSQYIKIVGLDNSGKDIFLERVNYYSPIKKIGLLYAIEDTLGIPEAEEVSKSLNEIKNNYSSFKS